MTETKVRNIDDFNKNNERIINAFDRIMNDALADDYNENDLLEKYANICLPLLFTNSLEKLKCVYRSRFVGLTEDICSPQTFSYVPKDINKTVPVKRKRMNLTGQSLFYSSNTPGTNYREIRLDVTKGDVVYVSQWHIVQPDKIKLYPLIRQAIDRLCENDSMSGLKMMLTKFHDLMLKPYEDGDEKAYIASAIIANKILNTHIEGIALPIAGDSITYDGILYPSVQAKSDKEFNVVFKPETVDKYLKLNYVIKGTVNEDMHSMNFAEIGFNHDGHIVWYRMEIDKDSLHFTECIVKCVGNEVIQCNTGDLFDENDLQVDIENVFSAEMSFFYDCICQKTKEKFGYEKIVNEASLEKEINRYVVGENVEGWRYKKSGIDLPIDILLFRISYRIHLIPITM